MKGRHLLWALPLVVFGCRCGGRSSADRTVFGAYAIEACDPMSPDTQLSRVGVERQLKLTFSLDAVRGTLHDYNTNDIIYAGGTQEKNYFTCEGHVIDGKPMASGRSLVAYDGRTRYPYEQEASLGCKPVPNGFAPMVPIVNWPRSGSRNWASLAAISIATFWTLVRKPGITRAPSCATTATAQR